MKIYNYLDKKCDSTLPGKILYFDKKYDKVGFGKIFYFSNDDSFKVDTNVIIPHNISAKNYPEKYSKMVCVGEVEDKYFKTLFVSSHGWDIEHQKPYRINNLLICLGVNCATIFKVKLSDEVKRLMNLKSEYGFFRLNYLKKSKTINEIKFELYENYFDPYDHLLDQERNRFLTSFNEYNEVYFSKINEYIPDNSTNYKNKTDNFPFMENKEGIFSFIEELNVNKIDRIEKEFAINNIFLNDNNINKSEKSVKYFDQFFKSKTLLMKDLYKKFTEKICKDEIKKYSNILESVKNEFDF